MSSLTETDDHIVLETIDYYEIDAATLEKFRGIDRVSTGSAQFLNLEEIGRVSGTYCSEEHGTYISATTKEGFQLAQDQVRMRAAMMGADAYTTYDCDAKYSPSGSKYKGCASSATCYGIAYKKRGPQI